MATGRPFFCLKCHEFECDCTHLMARYRPPMLSAREVQMLRLLASPSSPANKEIAYQLGMTEGSVKEYFNRIFKKLNAAGASVTNRTGAALWAMNHLKGQAAALGMALPLPEDNDNG